MGVRIIFAASEAAPFAKTGGLADVAGSLPVELKRLGCGVVLFLPLYREVAEKGLDLVEVDLGLDIPVGSPESIRARVGAGGRGDIGEEGVDTLKARLFKTNLGEVPVYFIKRDEYYDRTHLYGIPEGDYFDNLDRYAFFSRAVLEAIKACGFKPDIIHCNDWQTGLISAYLKDAYAIDPYFSKVATVFTIHNLAYQGLFPYAKFDRTGLSPELFSPEGVEFWGKINLLKAGVVYSDVITTVSEAYSREIQTEEFGWGLDGLLKMRKNDLYGILNGVDYSEWNPETDVLIPSNYSLRNMRGKSYCRRRLLREMKLPLKAGVPVIGIISRLAGQKGLDILCEAIPELVKLDLGLVILGAGERKYQTLVTELAARFPHKMAVRIGFDNRLAHLIEAGSDMFLMPSRYEPCGLNQIYSLKYGTIPIVRATGGLDDTVTDYKKGDGEGNGFKFADYTPKAIIRKVREALDVYRNRGEWKRLQEEAMTEDFSWHSSAIKYIDLYKAAIEKARAARAARAAEEAKTRAVDAAKTAGAAKEGKFPKTSVKTSSTGTIAQGAKVAAEGRKRGAVEEKSTQSPKKAQKSDSHEKKER